MAKKNRTITPSEQRAILTKEEVEGVEAEKRVKHITEVEELVDVLPDMAREYRGISAKIAPLEARKKELGAEIKALLDAVEVGSIRGDDWIAIRTKDTKTFTLSAEKLLMNGVEMDVIKESYDESPKAGFVQVKKWSPKSQGGGE